MNIIRSIVSREIQIPETPTKLEEISLQQPLAYLGVARSNDDAEALILSFQNKVADFHDNTDLSTMYVFRRCFNNDPSVWLKLRLLKFSAQNICMKTLKSPYTRYFVITILGLACLRVTYLSVLERDKILAEKYPNYRQIGSLDRRLYTRWGGLYGILVSMLSFLEFWLLIELNSFIEEAQGNILPLDIFYFNIKNPTNVLLHVEMRSIQPEKKKPELLNSSVEGGQVLTDPVTFEEIPDEDLNSPRAVLLTQYAFKVSTLISMMTENGNLRDGIKNIMHGGLLAPEDASNLISHLSAFLCIPDEEDFIKCFEKESPQERKEALKSITPVVLHKYI